MDHRVANSGNSHRRNSPPIISQTEEDAQVRTDVRARDQSDFQLNRGRPVTQESSQRTTSERRDHNVNEITRKMKMKCKLQWNK